MLRLHYCATLTFSPFPPLSSPACSCSAPPPQSSLTPHHPHVALHRNATHRQRTVPQRRPRATPHHAPTTHLPHLLPTQPDNTPTPTPTLTPTPTPAPAPALAPAPAPTPTPTRTPTPTPTPTLTRSYSHSHPHPHPHPVPNPVSPLPLTSLFLTSPYHLSLTSLSTSLAPGFRNPFSHLSLTSLSHLYNHSAISTYCHTVLRHHTTPPSHTEHCNITHTRTRTRTRTHTHKDTHTHTHSHSHLHAHNLHTHTLHTHTHTHSHITTPSLATPLPANTPGSSTHTTLLPALPAPHTALCSRTSLSPCAPQPIHDTIRNRHPTAPCAVIYTETPQPRT